MKNIKTLTTCASFSHALTLIDKLSENFRKTHKRNERAELTVAASLSPSDKNRSLIKTNSENIEIRCHYQTEDEADFNWFVVKIKEKN